MLGQCILILIGIFAIVVKYMQVLKNANENIQCDHSDAYYSGKKLHIG